ncbi:hypothetical protein LTR56_008785 [Elasticomyces elasticus]|nr:hypothetical protein LTR22_021967 [Elasticomyces elasticus]KAK3645907.1 hypothetical protein LTR56_008785 [Elasticomyces elasticus]KAK4928142.1 hypothetical protein LTR49_005080 [Elasticomyces elasticus]KAK5765894.1 hypothetical protein LTS12_003901 [Elasticomyces elasticus]
MGWLWSSSSPATAEEPTQTPAAPKNPIALSESQRQRIFGRSPVSQSPSTQAKADADLEAFLKSFEPGASSTTTSNNSTVAKPAEPEPEYEPPSRLNPDGTLNIHPSALYPATMSCRQAFDQAFYCQSLGGKFNDIYRFGHLKDCSEQWGAFWFCMRTRTLPERGKEPQIREFYRLRDEKRKEVNGGDSENVWELRTKAVERAFGRDPDAEEDGAVAVPE